MKANLLTLLLYFPYRMERQDLFNVVNIIKYTCRLFRSRVNISINKSKPLKITCMINGMFINVSLFYRYRYSFTVWPSGSLERCPWGRYPCNMLKFLVTLVKWVGSEAYLGTYWNIWPFEWKQMCALLQSPTMSLSTVLNSGLPWMSFGRKNTSPIWISTRS